MRLSVRWVGLFLGITLLLVSAYIRFRVPPDIFFEKIKLSNRQYQLVKLNNNGKFRLIAFWQTWCRDCHENMPDLSAAFSQHPNMELIAVSNEPIEKQENHQERLGKWVFFQLIGTAERPTQALQDIGVYSFPTYFLLDSTGKTVWSHTGDAEPSEIMRIIN